MTHHPSSEVLTQGKAQRETPFALRAGWNKVASSCVLGNVHQRYPTVILWSSERKPRTGTVSDSSLLSVLS